MGCNQHLSTLVLLGFILSSTHHIKANSPPPFKVLKFTVEPKDTVAKAGDKVWLDCSAKYDERAPTVYSWKRNNVLLTTWTVNPVTRIVMDNGSLFFTSVNPSARSQDPANYKCIAEATVGTKVHRIVTPEVTLSLAALPTLSSEPKNLDLHSGDTAMFRCESSAKPKATYTWARDGRSIIESNRVTLHSKGEVLEIKSLNRTRDAGQYRCTARNSAGQVSSSSAVLAIDGQAVAEEMSLTTPAEHSGNGDVGGDNSSSILSNIWGFFGGWAGKSTTTTQTPITLAATLTPFPYHLVFNFTDSTPGSLTPDLQSSELLPSTNPSSSPSLQPGVDTIGRRTPKEADFVMRPWDTTVVAGSPVTLFCAANGTDSNGLLPQITWLKKGSAIVSTRNYEGPSGRYAIVGSGSLRISNTSLDDEAVYTCRGENMEGMSDSEATLSVLAPPSFVTLPKNTYGRVEEDIILQCEISGTPPPRVLWYKDSDEVKESKYFKYVGHNLKILGLMSTDSGYFQCMGVNDAGKIQAVAQLIVLDEDAQVPEEDIQSYTSNPNLSQTVVPSDPSLPPPPSQLRAVIVSQTYITLTWGIELRPGVSPVTVYTVTTKQLGDPRTRAANVSSTDYTVEGLLPTTQYVFSVTSHNRNGQSLRSTNITVTTDAYAQVPEAVSHMRAWATSYDRIHVTWSPPSVTFGSISNYRVYFYSQNQSRELFKEVGAGDNTVSINDLHPYTEYYIRVVASNGNGPGTPTEEKRVRTYSTEPTGTPTNVTVEAVGTSEISIRWSPPLPQHRNGQITGYRIRHKRKDSSGKGSKATPNTTDADARSFDITGLSAGVVYLVRIAAINSNGTGDFTSWSEVTTFAVELDESRAPGKPSFIQLKAFAREMIVSWGAPEDSDEVMVRGYRLGYGIGFPEQYWIEDIPHSTRIYSLVGLEPRKNYVVQVMAFNNADSGLSAQQQEFTLEELDRPTDSELLPPLEVKVKVISSTSVMVTWYDSTLGQNQKPLYDHIYTVKYNALSGSAQRKTQFRNTSDLFMRVDGLRPYTKYEFSVMTSRGNRVSIYSLGARNTTFEDKPSSPPRDLTVTKIDNKPSYLMVSWQPPSNPNGKIIHYTIYSNTNLQLPLEKWAVESVEGHQLNHRFGPVTPSTVFFFRIAAHNSKGASPPSETKALKSADASVVVPVNTGRDKEEPETDKRGNSGWVDTRVDGSELKSKSGTTQGPPLQNFVQSTQTLWIIIACVSAITVLAIAALVAVICRKRIMKERKRPANLKASNQAPKGMNKGFKQQPPDLWIDHEQVELKAMEKPSEPNVLVDERTAMLQSHSQFDVTSASMMGDNYADEPRYSTLGRQRPVIIAPQHHRDDERYYEIPTYNPYSTMPRAAVQPMTVENNRPLYPRTQFTSHNYGSAPRVHMGDTSQPSTETSSFCTDPVTGLTGVATPIPNGFTNGDLESYSHSTSTPFNKPYMINGEEVPPPRPPPMEGRPYPLRSFNNSNGTGHNIPKHIVKPQPISAFKPAVPPPEEPEFDSGSLKRPPRPPYINRQLSQGSLGREPLKMSLRSGSTEHLSSEMAHLDHIMQDLNSIKNDF